MADSTNSSPPVGWTELTDAQVEKLRSECKRVSFPMLFGTDSHNKWHVHSGKDVESGIISSCHIHDYGTVWKVECVVDCTAEKFFKSIMTDFDVFWIPHLDIFQVLSDHGDYLVFQQITRGVTAVADREFVTVQFPNDRINDAGQRCYYSLSCSVDEDNYEKMNHDCVRGWNHPGGWAWTPIGDGSKSLFSFIYNTDLKGYLPKRLVNWAAAGFLMRFIKAAQQQSRVIAVDGHKKMHISPSSSPSSSKKGSSVNSSKT